MNTSALKNVGFWVGLLAAILGVLVSQGVVVDGSTVATVIGWIMTLIGTAGAGHSVGTTKTEPTV